MSHQQLGGETEKAQDDHPSWANAVREWNLKEHTGRVEAHGDEAVHDLETTSTLNYEASPNGPIMRLVSCSSVDQRLMKCGWKVQLTLDLAVMLVPYKQSIQYPDLKILQARDCINEERS